MEDDTVQCKVTRPYASDGHAVMTVKLGFIYLVGSSAAVNAGGPLPRYNLVNTQKKPLISTVDYTLAWPSQTGLIPVFPFFIFKT